MIEENPLSSRENEILTLLAQGKSNKEIASDLVISVNTVKVHISNIFQKLNLSSRSEAMMYALEQGIIEAPRQEAPEPQIITEIVEAELPKWLNWLRRFWWLPAILLVLGIVALSLFFSRSPLLARPTPSPDPFLNMISQNRWQGLDALKPARSGIAAVSYRQQIFAIGGESLEGISALNQSFNTRSNRWLQHQAKPTAVKDAKAILLDGKIYVFGGELTDGKTSNLLEVYDIESDSWETKSPAPFALSRVAATLFEGKIYIFGGWDGTKLSDQTFIYDPGTDSWHSGPRSPLPFADAFAVTANDHIMLIGGNQERSVSKSNALEAINTLRIFTPDKQIDGSKAWSEPLELFQTERIYLAQDLGDSIVVFSDYDGEKTLVSYYSVQSETWMHSVESSQITILSNAGLANQGGAIYFIGGSDDFGAFSEHFGRYQAVFTITLPAISN